MSHPVCYNRLMIIETEMKEKTLQPLFDLDGTLAATFKDLFWALNQALEEHGYKMIDRNVRRREGEIDLVATHKRGW